MRVQKKLTALQFLSSELKKALNPDIKTYPLFLVILWQLACLRLKSITSDFVSISMQWKVNSRTVLLTSLLKIQLFRVLTTGVVAIAFRIDFPFWPFPCACWRLNFDRLIWQQMLFLIVMIFQTNSASHAYTKFFIKLC